MAGAWAQDGDLISAENAVDFRPTSATPGQYRAIKYDASTPAKFVRCGAADVGFVGIMQDDLDIGKHGTVKTATTSKAVAGAAVARAGIALTTDAEGRLITAVSTNVIVARSEGAAAAAGDLFPVRIERAGVVA